MNVRLIVASVLLIVPALLPAQGRGGGRRSGRGGGDESGRGAAKANHLSADDIQKLNPAKVLLDKRKDLKIDDGQKAQLETIANRYDWNTRVFVAMADSLDGLMGHPEGRARMRGRGSDDSPPDSSRGTIDDQRRTHAALLEALRSVRQEYDTASARSLNVLTEAQRDRGTKLVEKPTAAIADQLEKWGLSRRQDETKPPL